MPLGFASLTRAVCNRARRGLYAGRRVLSGNQISDDGGNKCVQGRGSVVGAERRQWRQRQAAARLLPCPALPSPSPPPRPAPLLQVAPCVEAQLSQQAALLARAAAHGAAARHCSRATVRSLACGARIDS